MKSSGIVDNFEYGNFENLTSRLGKTPNRSLCWELSAPLSAYSYCRSVLLAGLGKGMSALGRAREGDS